MLEMKNILILKHLENDVNAVSEKHIQTCLSTKYIVPRGRVMPIVKTSEIPESFRQRNLVQSF